MADDSQTRMLNSEVSFQIIKELQEHEKYAKELSEEIGSSRNSIANYLNMLRDAGIIDRGKRTQAQYYKLNYNGLTNFWFDEIEKTLNNTNEFFTESALKEFQEKEQEVKDFSRKYFKTILSTTEENLTLYEFLFTSYAFAISRYQSKANFEQEVLDKDTDFPEFLTITLMALTEHMELPDYNNVISIVQRLSGDSELREAIEDIEN